VTDQHVVRTTMAALFGRFNAPLIRRFRDDVSGSYLIISAIVMSALVGFVGVGTDIGLWYYAHQAMQSAADSSAVSAATAYSVSNTRDLSGQANAVAASYGFINGTAGTVVTVNRPPLSGTHTTAQNAVEVIIQQPQNRLFSALWSSQQVNVTARSVALGDGGLACVLALDPTASGAATAQGSTTVALNGCSLFSDSNDASSVTVGGSAQITALSVGAVGGIPSTSGITTTLGVSGGDAPISDPYANTSYPAFAGCDHHNYTAKNLVTIDPGVYCGGITLNAGANVTLNPGIYYLDQGDLSVNGSATLTGTGVTLVFTSSNGKNYSTATINGGATVNLTAPTSGPTAGIVIFADRNMPVGTAFKFNGGATQVLSGAVYVPKGAVTYAGGAGTTNGCSQLIGDTVTFTGNSNFAINCSGKGTKPIGSSTAKLVE
jgi:Flp pilus assembly protein TadG